MVRKPLPAHSCHALRLSQTSPLMPQISQDILELVWCLFAHKLCVLKMVSEGNVWGQQEVDDIRWSSDNRNYTSKTSDSDYKEKYGFMNRSIWPLVQCLQAENESTGYRMIYYYTGASQKSVAGKDLNHKCTCWQFTFCFALYHLSVSHFLFCMDVQCLSDGRLGGSCCCLVGTNLSLLSFLCVTPSFFFPIFFYALLSPHCGKTQLCPAD